MISYMDRNRGSLRVSLFNIIVCLLMRKRQYYSGLRHKNKNLLFPDVLFREILNHINIIQLEIPQIQILIQN